MCEVFSFRSHARIFAKLHSCSSIIPSSSCFAHIWQLCACKLAKHLMQKLTILQTRATSSVHRYQQIPNTNKKIHYTYKYIQRNECYCMCIICVSFIISCLIPADCFRDWRILCLRLALCFISDGDSVIAMQRSSSDSLCGGSESTADVRECDGWTDRGWSSDWYICFSIRSDNFSGVSVAVGLSVTGSFSLPIRRSTKIIHHILYILA